jgi:predicted hydrocarbon binding protein
MMNAKIPSFVPSRREFLLNVLPAGTLFCLGCGSLFAMAGGQEKQQTAEKKHKFLEDSGMSYEEVCNFAFKDGYIPLLQNLAQRLRGNDFIEMLKNATHELAVMAGREWAKSLPKNDFATYTSELKKLYTGPFWDHVITNTYVENTDRVQQWKITECLFAKTFREANASDIGYATMCYSDYGFTEGFNPKIKFTRTKTLMQGDDCCNHRNVWEG